MSSRRDKKLLQALPKEAVQVTNIVNTIKRKQSRKTNFLDSLEKLILRTVENMASVKFLILVISTVFFYFGKLSEGTWQETVLIVAGLRAVNEVAAMYKKPGAETPAEKVESDA